MICFYANIDSTKKFDENVEIYTYKFGSEKAIKVVDSTIIGLPKGMIISKNRALFFNKSCDKLFFGIAQMPMKRDTSINDEEIAKLDVWNYKDDYISTQQLGMKSTMLKKSYLSYITIDTTSGQAINNSLIRLATKEYPFIIIPKEKSGDIAYSFSNEKYAIQSQWDANSIGDLYFISIKDGSKKLIKEGLYANNMKASPDGKYLIWYDPQQKNWFSIELSMNSSEPINITKEINYPLWQELNDIPKMAPPYGEGGWSDGDKTFYVYDKYDVWAVDPSGKNKPISITEGLGRKNEYTFKLIRLDELQLPEGTPGIKNNPIKASDDLYFTAFDNKSKGYGYYTRSNKRGKLLPMRELIMEPNFSLGYLNKAKKANVITYTKSNFTECPNLWVTKNFFKTSKKLTDVNPQQKDYIWGTCELVYWTSKDGEKLEGLLYKPENFDSTKAYPMVVYFYERNSNNKNVYRRPNVSRSTINVSYFVSNGYLVFIPDICYKIGHPGKSAYNCIVSGVEELCKNKWVDSNNMAIQGQSWGGYQVAYLITQTNIFKCAGAGAPVTNMTSAYGGIRWGTGRVRQFQYEQTQSRIGKSLWDKGGLELYLENSPLFYADKVNTPLLIMHNDKDEAVPWYQGIEYFTALRRLGKQVWMLQYNGETHNISKRVNALDYTIRLSQFMDHFLKGAPMPIWMDKGIPATEKGINLGLDLIEKN
jgi:Dipeptidyl aminopeptidases/acylaminoacyl-peptidases